MSVPPPPELAAPQPSGDTVQDLISKKRDAEKNKYKYHLTETDCVLICTNATERIFHDGEVIVSQGDPIKNVYRIKSGKISLQLKGSKLYDLTQGFFIGEGIFIRNEFDEGDTFGATFIANGPVLLSEVNIPFVRQLLNADKVLAFKLYKHIAGKLSALLLTVAGSIEGVNEAYIPSPASPERKRHSSSSSSLSSSSPVISSSSSRTPSASSLVFPHAASSPSLSTNPSPSSSRSSSLSSTPPPLSLAPISSSPSSSSLHSESSRASLESEESGISVKEENSTSKSLTITEAMANVISEKGHARATKKKLRFPRCKKEKTILKVYHLEGNHFSSTAHLTSHKIIITTGSGILNKYNRILDIGKTGRNSATIIHGVQARTLFFKTEEDLEEFCGVVNSFIQVVNSDVNTSFSAPQPTPRFEFPAQMHQSPNLQSPLRQSVDPSVIAEDKLAMKKLATAQTLKKGDLIVAEGDLLQRIYTMVSGEVHLKRRGRLLASAGEGQVFSVVTLFHLRPSLLDIEVVSDTASVLIIPGYRINDLITTNFPLAVRLHKKAAQLIYGQVANLIDAKNGNVGRYSDLHVLL